MYERLLFIFGMCLLVRLIKTVLKLNEVAGHKSITAFLIGADTVVFFVVFKDVLTGELTIPVMAAAAGGYIMGYLIGANIEERMALGHVLVTIKAPKEDSKEISAILKKHGFIFVRSKRAYTHNNKLRKMYQGVILRKELPKLKRILRKQNIMAYVEPIKSTFGKEPINSQDYLKMVNKKE